MRVTTTVLSICMALLIPFSVAAKKPESEVCNIAVVYTDLAFEVRVRPSSGQWFQPTVSVEMVLPLMEFSTPGTYSQIVTQEFDGLGIPNNALAFFAIPPETRYLNVDLMGTFNVFATVSEPVNKGKSIETHCETSVSLVE